MLSFPPCTKPFSTITRFPKAQLLMHLVRCGWCSAHSLLKCRLPYLSGLQLPQAFSIQQKACYPSGQLQAGLCKSLISFKEFWPSPTCGWWACYILDLGGIWFVSVPPLSSSPLKYVFHSYPNINQKNMCLPVSFSPLKLPIHHERRRGIQEDISKSSQFQRQSTRSIIHRRRLTCRWSISLRAEREMIKNYLIRKLIYKANLPSCHPI